MKIKSLACINAHISLSYEINQMDAPHPDHHRRRSTHRTSITFHRELQLSSASTISCNDGSMLQYSGCQKVSEAFNVVWIIF